MKRLSACVLLTILWSLAPAQEARPGKRPIAIEDLYLFDGPKSVVLAPGAQRAVFVRTWIDKATRKERNALWLADGSKDKARPMEADEPDARSPVFSPDGKWIAFLSTRPGGNPIPPTPPQSDAGVSIWLIPSEGGKAIPLVARGAEYGRVFHDGFYGRLAFSPDGDRLAFVADTGTDPRTKEEIDNDVQIVRPDQGEGYTGYGPAQIFVAYASKDGWPAARIQPLTSDDVWYGDPQWSPDGKTIVVHANKTKDRESVRYSINKNFDLWAIPADGSPMRQLTSGPGPEVSPRFSPDGNKILCLSGPRKGPHRDTFNLGVVHLGEGGPRFEVLFDHHGPGADKPPHPAPAFPLPDDAWDCADRFRYTSERGTGMAMLALKLDQGKATLLPTDASSWKARAVLLGKLTPESNAFLKERLIAPGQVISWHSTDGTQIEGIFTAPPPEVARAPYKLIVYPHGGPHSRSAMGFDFTVQVFAAHGYAVFQPNFRGSSGYGQKFIDADRNDLGGGDMRDILSGIDHLIGKKLVNPKQQFVYGISYGGFMTSWLVGQTRQFRAAAAQNAVTDHNMMWGLSDLQSWTQWEFGGLPWEVPAAMRKHSPLTHAANVKTPTLILHARDDRRCPLPMGQAFHQALLAQGVPTQMVIYPDEGHGIRQPRHREDVLRRVLAWFAKHS